MKEQKEVRIIARPAGDKVEISVYEVYRMKEHRTGMKVFPDEVDKTVLELKSTLEKSGNRVTFKLLCDS